jgi:hypothetical protein
LGILDCAIVTPFIIHYLGWQAPPERLSETATVHHRCD